MKPITALAGPNQTAKRDYLEKLVQGISKDELSIYFADEADAGVIFSQASQDSLFGSQNVVIVKNIDGLSDKDSRLFDEALENYLNHPNLSANLILIAEKFLAGIVSLIKKNGELLEFKKAYRNDLVSYTSGKLREAKVQFDNDLPDYLVTLAGEDGEILEGMTAQIVSFSNGAKVTVENAKSLLTRAHGMDIFDFLDGIFLRDVQRALSALEDLRLSGESLIRINSMVLRSAKLLWGYHALKNKGDAVQALKIRPFEAKKMADYARKTDLKTVSAVIELVRRVEVKIKSMPLEFAILEYETFLLAR